MDKKVILERLSIWKIFRMKTTEKKWSIQQFLIHAFLWAMVWLFYTQFLGFQDGDFYKVIGFSFFLMPVTIATTYTSIYYLIPKYLLTKRYDAFSLYALYTVIFSAYGIVISIYCGLIFLSNSNATEMLPITKSLLMVFIGVYLIVFLASAFFLLRYNQETLERNYELKQRLLEGELRLNEQKLAYLKMQIHPHFLFNTLNTMYGFALQKSDKTPDMILKLSNLLDYLLYQVDDQLVELKQEVQHIQDYIALEQLRFQERLQIQFLLEGTWEHILIAPMLLLPFVENAFKHGTMEQGVLTITIVLKVEQRRLHFRIQNTAHENVVTQGKHSGIGLKNVQKRLDLLYGENYALTVARKQYFYTVNLTLKEPKTIR